MGRFLGINDVLFTFPDILQSWESIQLMEMDKIVLLWDPWHANVKWL